MHLYQTKKGRFDFWGRGVIGALLVLNWSYLVLHNYTDTGPIPINIYRDTSFPFHFFKVRSKVLKSEINIRFVKADMNSDILLQTAAIFFLPNLYLKQGIRSVYVMVYSICKG